MKGAARNRFHGGTESSTPDISIALVLRANLDRESLAALLRTQSGLRIVGETASGAQAGPLCARERPTVAIIDTTCLWPAGSCRVAELLEAAPRTRILALAAHDAPWCAVLNPQSCPEAFECNSRNGAFDCLRIAVQEGAHGVLRRGSGSRELFRAIRALARGRFWVGSEVSLSDSQDPPLSDRERAVAWLVGQGRSNKEIARTLTISDLTVKKHISHILRKTRLQDRLQLGLCVARHPSLFSMRAPLDRAQDPRVRPARSPSGE